MLPQWKERIEKAAQIVDTVRRENPLVDCITNFVTVNDCANILLAFGASPAMCDAHNVSFDFTQLCGALYINTGTYIHEHETSALESMAAAKQAGIPVVLDPVACAAMPKLLPIIDRLRSVGEFSIIKGNMGEIMALAGIKAQVKGVDSGGDMQGIEEAAKNVAQRYGCTVAATGKADVITDGNMLVRVHNGVDMLTKITGAGCMVGALCGATAAAAKKSGADMFDAALAGIVSMGIAGEQAAEKTQLPGSYRVALIDSIYTVTGAVITEKGKLQ